MCLANKSLSLGFPSVCFWSVGFLLTLKKFSNSLPILNGNGTLHLHLLRSKYVFLTHTHTYGHLWCICGPSRGKASSVSGLRLNLGGHLGFCAMYEDCLRIWRVSRLVCPQGHFLQECERTGVSTIEEGRERA